jgi:hypothetical protein
MPSSIKSSTFLAIPAGFSASLFGLPGGDDKLIKAPKDLSLAIAY